MNCRAHAALLSLVTALTTGEALSSPGAASPSTLADADSAGRARASAPAASPRPSDSLLARWPPLHFRKTVFAAGKDIPSPVAFSVDEHGVVYTADALRYFNHGHFDVRAFPDVGREDWASQSVAERRRLTERWVREGRFDGKTQKVTLDWLRGFSDQIRRLEDTDGDGRADRIDVFADSMNDLANGCAAGVLAWDGRVYATSVPQLLLYTDSTGSGHPVRRVLADGFALHMGQAGHDLHGLTIGNDGRLYWSMADRGFDVTTREGRRLFGHTGAVFRCWPDGAGVELFAWGLRNPQELAFDDHGDLFTGDNNADIGDRSRLLYLPQGSDAGWNFYMQSMRDCGPWSREHLWERRFPRDDPAQPAWLNVPAGYLGSCPSGMTAYPGTGLPPRYDGTLWLADFIGGVAAFRAEPRGAGFELEDLHDGFRDSWGICDFDFDVDGRAWALYWGESWAPSDKARLVTLTPLEPDVDTLAVAEVRRLFHEGFAALDDARLAALLGHADRRVRQRACFELARRGRAERFAEVLAEGRGGAGPSAAASRRLAKLHALWGLGIVAHERGVGPVAAPILAALADPDPEVRRVAASVAGDMPLPAAGPRLVGLLSDPEPRVRFAAAQAVAGLGAAGAVEPLIAALAANDDRDAFLRFAYARALARSAPPARLAALRTDARKAVRLGAVLALREAGAEAVSAFLADPHPQVAVEAARAAYDLQLPGAMRALAATLPGLRADRRVEPYLRRAIQAALRVGGADQALQVATFAADTSVAESWREEAVSALAEWDRPDDREGVSGLWAPLPAREAGRAHEAVARHLNAILARVQGPGLAVAVALARRENVNLDNTVLLHWVGDESQNDYTRVAALQWLMARGAPEAAEAIRSALASRSDSVFAAGLGIEMRLDPPAAVAAARRAVDSRATPLPVRQAAVRALGTTADAGAVALLSARLAALRDGTLEPELRLDVLQAARASPAPELQHAVKAYDASLDRRDPLAAYLVAMHGGDAERGRSVFTTHPAAQCIRCHRVDGAGGDVGPDLSSVGARDRRYLLAALITPSAAIAQGYEFTSLTLRDGSALSGRVLSENRDQIVILVNDRPRTCAKSAILRRPPAGSLMPSMQGTLEPEEIRDVIEYLATRRDFAPDLPLGSLTAVAATTGFGTVGRDQSCMSNPLRVAGHTYAHGVGVHAPSRLAYDVPDGVRAFVARVGVDDEARSGLVGFEVRVDGRSAWRSGPVSGGQLAKAYVEIPAGARRIELLVDDGGNGTNSDHADWCEAGFVK